MIGINLLPPEFRVKPKNPQKGRYILFAILGLTLFTVITFVLYVDFLKSSSELNRLDRKWKDLFPQQQVLVTLQKEVDGPLKSERQFMERFVITQRPLTHILQAASESLPDSAWLEEVTLSRNQGNVILMIKGACLSGAGKTSIEHIETYLGQLKKKIEDSKILLKTTRVMIGSTEVTQFIVNFSWSEVTEFADIVASTSKGPNPMVRP